VHQEPAHAVVGPVLLVGREREDDVALERRVLAREAREDRHPQRREALVVLRAAPVEPPVALDELEGVQ